MAPTPAARPATPRLDIGDAVHDGWRAFCRSPRDFVLFALLLWGLQILCQLVQSRIGTSEALSSQPSDWILALLGLTAGVVVSLWGSLGMVRGALSALAGGRPSLALLCRWEGGAMSRLVLATLLLGTIVGGSLLAIVVVVGGPLALLLQFKETAIGSGGAATLLAIFLSLVLVLLLGLWLIGLIYFNVNQQFLAQIALREGLGPWATLQRGRQLADPQWPLLLLLMIVEGLLGVLGVLACFVGFFVAWPVVVCVATAAYQQLLGLPKGGAAPSLSPADAG